VRRTTSVYVATSSAGEPALSASVSAPGRGKKNDRSYGWAARLTCRWRACPDTLILAHTETSMPPNATSGWTGQRPG